MAPNQAFELGFNTSYTQGWGKLGGRLDVEDVAGAGINLGLGLSYRFSPQLSVGLTAAYQAFSEGDRSASSGSQGMTVGLEASYHFMPFQEMDPVISLGTGYRLLWVDADDPIGGSHHKHHGGNDNGHEVLVHGFQIAKLSAGLDFRVSKEFAIGPMIGADLNYFVWANPAGDRGNVELENTGLSTFIYAGLQGRFDIGSKDVAETPRMSSY